MQYDPHRTGSPPKPIEPTGFFTGIQIRPIITGAVVDFIATFALVAFYYRFYVAQGSGVTEGFEEEMAKYWLSADGLLASLLLGSLGTYDWRVLRRLQSRNFGDEAWRVGRPMLDNSRIVDATEWL